MNAKEELMKCSLALRSVMESPAVWMEPPWLDAQGAFVRVRSWRESAFDLEIETKETAPAL